eukprot:Partr_v1_DN27429_c0_g1_i1_m72186 putative NADH dehydrogenase (ubiquinone) Fe-S protein 4, 18kDa (NADH-coenzyme Q reductase)
MNIARIIRRQLSTKPSTPEILASEASKPTTIQASTSAGGQLIPVHKEKLIPAYRSSGSPDELITNRRVRIFKPSRTAMQSGTNENQHWQIDFDTKPKWENPLMGYTSSGDYVQGLRMRFHERTDAIQFAEKQGWDYIVQEEQVPKFRGKSYSDNFKYSKNRLRFLQTK